MKTVVIALRNLQRNRRRSLATLLAMIIGLASLLLFGGYINDIKYGLQTDFVQRSGHLQIHRKDYFLYGSGNPAAYGIRNYQRIIALVQADPVLAPMLAVVTPTLQLGGIAGNFSAGVSRTVLGYGMVVADQNRMRKWNEYGLLYTPIDLALTGASADAAVIGNGVARVLQLCAQLEVSNCPSPLRDKNHGGIPLSADVVALSSIEAAAVGEIPLDRSAKIEVLAANTRGAPNVASLAVVKAEDQGVKEFDDMYIGMHLAQAQSLVYGAETPQVTSIVIQLDHTAQMPAVQARLNMLLAATPNDGEFEVQDFPTLNPFYGQTLKMFSAVFGFIAVLIGAIVLFTVSNTMNMAVVARTVEIGTLRAMGVRRSGIRRLFLCEGLLLGAAGVVLGILAALVIAGVINASGLSWIPPGRITSVPLSVQIWGDTELIVSSAFGLVFTALLSALLPADRAARLEVVDALRHV